MRQPKTEPASISPADWLAIANKRAPQRPNVTEWFSGDTHPAKPGCYERLFTDGIMSQWWSGSEWMTHSPTDWRGSSAHWRQAGDYPCWRGCVEKRN